MKYLERTLISPDKSALGQSNGTERTVDTVASASDDDEDESADASGLSPIPGPDDPANSTAELLLKRQPSKSAMKYKTLEESLKTQYESTRRKMVRERKLRAKKKKKKNGSSRRMKLKKAISKMTLTSRRDLFDSDPDAKFELVAEPANSLAVLNLNEEGGGPPPNRRDSMGSTRSKSAGCLALSDSEHHAWEEEHNDRVPELKTHSSNMETKSPAEFQINRRADLSRFKSTGMLNDIVDDDNDESGGSAQHKGKPMKSMRNLFATSKSKLGTSLSSLFSHGSKSECFTVDEDDGEEGEAHLLPTLLAFDTVEIREYDPEVDANPCVSRGPAVTLGWTYTTSSAVDLHQYEEYRPPRRAMKEMRLPREVRESRLLASGISRSEMQASVKQANLAKQRRSKTLRNLRHYTIHERLEGMKKKCLKIVGKRKSHEEEERKLWEEAQYYFGP